jgi:hypothetical protein
MGPPRAANEKRDEDAGGALSALDSVGVACARGTCAALLVGLIEGAIVGARFGVGEGSAGLALATAGLWFPAALVSLLPGAALVRAANDRRRRTIVLATFAVALFITGVVASSWSRAPFNAMPLEIVAVLLAGWGASLVRLEGPVRRPAAFVGIALAVLVQLYANRWIEVHRALAGALADHTFIPRVMLRSILRRFA